MRSTGDSGGQANNTTESAALLWELGNNGYGICLCKVMERCLLKEVTAWCVILNPARLSLFSLSVCIPGYLSFSTKLSRYFLQPPANWSYESDGLQIFVDSKQNLACRFFFNCRSQWPRGLNRGSAAARLLGLRVRIPPGAWDVSPYECCVWSGRGLCDWLITRPEETCRVWCVWVWGGLGSVGDCRAVKERQW